MTNDRTDRQNAPLVSVTEARVYQDRDDAEAYIARVGLDPATVAICPLGGGRFVLAHIRANGAIRGYEA